MIPLISSKAWTLPTFEFGRMRIWRERWFTILLKGREIAAITLYSL
jgi:hypothetical protein